MTLPKDPARTLFSRISAKTAARELMATAKASGRRLSYTQALAELARFHGYANVHEMTASYVTETSAAAQPQTIRDFFNSILKRRLFEHLTRLRHTYAPPVLLLLEGDLSRADELDNPRAFFGALVAVSLDLGLFVVPSPSRAASADVITLLAKRLGKARGHVALRYKPPLLSEAEEQRFAVQGLPGIGDVMSENLLARFGNVRRVFSAGHEELLATRGIGPKRAEAISRFLDRAYAPHRGRIEATPDEAAPESEEQPSDKTTKAA